MLMMSVAIKLINLSVVMKSAVILNVVASKFFLLLDFGTEKPKMYSGSNTVIKHSTHSNMIKVSNPANNTRRTVDKSKFVNISLSVFVL
jgi:hypothetical protein